MINWNCIFGRCEKFFYTEDGSPSCKDPTPLEDDCCWLLRWARENYNPLDRRDPDGQ